MKGQKLIYLVMLIGLLLLAVDMLAARSAAAPSAGGSQAADSQARVATALAASPVMFIQNVGQFDERARFQVRGGEHTIWLAEDGL